MARKANIVKSIVIGLRFRLMKTTEKVRSAEYDESQYIFEDKVGSFANTASTYF